MLEGDMKKSPSNITVTQETHVLDLARSLDSSLDVRHLSGPHEKRPSFKTNPDS